MKLLGGLVSNPSLLHSPLHEEAVIGIVRQRQGSLHSELVSTAVIMTLKVSPLHNLQEII